MKANMIQLQEWAKANSPGENCSAYWNQIMFVRDKVASLLSSSFEQYRTLVQVYSTHRSKGILCPVYFIHLKDQGVRIWMRYNFHNWNISVLSDKPIGCDFLDVFSDETGHGDCYCEGMKDKKFGRYRDNGRKFTVSVDDDYDASTFFRALRKFFNIKRVSQD